MGNGASAADSGSNSDAICRLKELISESDNIVFFGGAGVSTESGIPDFRGDGGLYARKYKYPAEFILSHEFFHSQTGEFYEFYRDKMIFPDALPNTAHKALVELERQGKLQAVITQNIDGLHQAAGGQNILELHGSVLRNFCMDCGAFYGISIIQAAETLKNNGVPRCSCGGIIKPDVVLYGEGLSQGLLERAAAYVSDADMLIIGGTSLGVYPAAGLVYYYRGSKLVLINKSATPMNDRADLLINMGLGDTLSWILEANC